MSLGILVLISTGLFLIFKATTPIQPIKQIDMNRNQVSFQLPSAETVQELFNKYLQQTE